MADTTSLSNMLTAVKNLAVAMNAVAQNYISVHGAQSLSNISAATVLKPSAGRLATVSVTTAGAAGAAYDANQTGVTSNPIFIIPDVVGVYVVNMPTNNGIVIAPGTSQVVAASFS